MSQVVPYVTRLARRGVQVAVQSFEKTAPDAELGRRLAEAGVDWHPHGFGSAGSVGGLVRVVRGARAAGRDGLVHARSDLPAASCLLARRDRWVWDMRSLWREERVSAGLLRPRSPEARLMRLVESAAARRSGRIVTLADAAVGVLRTRYGDDVAGKARVITTCVELERFPSAPFSSPDPLKFLLAGTLSAVYDVRGMVDLVARARARRPASLTVLTPVPRAPDPLLGGVDARVATASPTEMPGRIRDSHVGLCMRRPDVSNAAAMPTKLAEFLASGRPVVVNAGLGDMDSIVERYRCGVVVDDSSDDGLDRAVTAVEDLVADLATPARCRRAAEEHFDIEAGVDRLLALYGEVAR